MPVGYKLRLSPSEKAQFVTALGIFSKPWGKAKAVTQGREVAKIFKKKVRFCLLW
jgi:hypothetical protein